MAAIAGTLGNDSLQGTVAADEILGLAGDDTINGLSGDDSLNGNEGEDTVDGGEGNDLVRGGQDNDRLFGNNGDDTVYGDKGNDSIFGNSGQDLLFGGEGDDTLNAGTGNDFLNGNEGVDILYGGQNDDTLRGGLENDRLFGDKENDLLYGDKGADTITGGVGDDTFVIGQGTGGPEITDADCFLDFGLGKDFIGLIDGLKFADLNIFSITDENDANSGNIIIQNRHTEEFLAILKGAVGNGITLTAEDFVDLSAAEGTEPETPATEVVLSNGNIAENSANGTIVGTLSTTGADKSAATFTLLNDGDGRFAIDNNQIVVANGGDLLDFETNPTIELIVQATNAAGLTLEKAVTVPLINVVNEENPGAAPSEINLSNGSVTENSPAGTLVGELSATDETGTATTFSLVDDAEGRFVLVGDRIQVAEDAEINFEETPTIPIRVRVANGNGQTLDRVLNLTVENVPDELSIGAIAPTAIDQDTSANIPITIGDIEVAIGEITITGNSSNTGLIENENISVIGEGANRSLTITPTSVQSGTAEITLNLNDGDRTATQTLRLTVEAPTTDLVISNSNIAENSANGTIVGTLSTTGADKSAATFTLLNDGDGRFAIDNNQIVVANGGDLLDFETNPTIELIVQATNAAGLTLEKAVTVPLINVVNEENPGAAPSEINLSNGSVTENSPAGTLVGELSATDETGTATTFSLVDDAGGRFVLVGDRIQVGEDAEINFEETPTIPIRVRVANGNGQTLDRVLNLTVENVPDELSIGAIAPTSISQDTSANIPITIGETEVATGPIAITGTSSNPTLIPNENISVVGEGVNFSVIIIPAPGQSGNAEITLNLNDGSQTATQTLSFTVVPPPAAIADIAISNSNIAENSPNGTLVGTLSTIGADESTASFSLLDDAGGRFAIFGDLLIVANGGPALDFESNPTIPIAIQTTTANGAVFDKVFSIPLIDIVNESNPGTPPTDITLTATEVAENSPSGTVVGTLGIPEGSDGATFALLDDADGKFTITGNQLQVAADGAIDFEETPIMPIILRATNASGQTLDRRIELTVTDIPDELTIEAIAPVSTRQDTPTTVAIAIGDSEIATPNLTISGSSSNPALIPNENIVIVGSGANRTLTITPASGQSGIAEITLNLNDSDRTATQTITVNILEPVGTQEQPLQAFLSKPLEIPEIQLTTNNQAVVAVSNPINGTVTLENGIITFTADPGYVGPASFDFTVENAAAEPTTLTANVEVSEETDVDTLTQGNGGFQITGESNPDEGKECNNVSVVPSEDVNGDGLPDLVAKDSNADKNFLIFGKEDGNDIDLTKDPAESGEGYRIFAQDPGDTGDKPNYNSTSLGDINGDELEDVIYNNSQEPPPLGNSIPSYVVFGQDPNATASPFLNSLLGLFGGSLPKIPPSNINVKNLGTKGFQIVGNGTFDQGIRPIIKAGDINGDDRTDLLVQSPVSEPNIPDYGPYYILFGKENNLPVDFTYLNNPAPQTFAIPDPNPVKVGFAIKSAEVLGTPVVDFAQRDVLPTADINDDGNDDLLIGFPKEEAIGFGSNRAFVVFGKSDEQPIDLTDLSAPPRDPILSLVDPFEIFFPPQAKGFDITSNNETLAGRKIQAGGDTNDDDFSDLLIEADPDPNSSSNKSYVVFGKNNSKTVNLDNLGGEGYFIGGDPVIDPATGQEKIDPATGKVASPVPKLQDFSMLPAGDMNGDEKQDIVLVPQNEPEEIASKIYVIFGKEDENSINLNDLSPPPLTTIQLAIKATLAFFGISYPDPKPRGFAIANPTGFDRGTGLVNLAQDLSNRQVIPAGDVNGDGLDDVIIGPPKSENQATRLPGDAYVVFGKDEAQSIDVNLQNLGSGGFRINNSSSGDITNFSITPAGDFNGDGLEDLIVAPPKDDPLRASGPSYVIYGKSNAGPRDPIQAFLDPLGLTFPLPPPIALPPVDLSNLADRGFAIAPSGDRATISVKGGQDINEDGFNDLTIETEVRHSEDKVCPGPSYFVFGTPAFEGGTVIEGDAENNTLNGTEAAEVIKGGRGNDVISPGGGLDNIAAGLGDDIIIINNVGFDRISGGKGSDVLRVDSTEDIQLDFTPFPVPSIQGIEQIDLTSAGNHTLKINGANFKRIPDRNQNNQQSLVVLANAPIVDELGEVTSAGDVVTLEGFLSDGTEGGLNKFIFEDETKVVLVSPGVTVNFAGFNVVGTDEDDLLTGTAKGDRLIGNPGNDVLIGGGREDDLQGGAGDDVLIVSDPLFKNVSGGIGNDTLRIEGANITLDLRASALPPISQISQIDLTGFGDNTLTLDTEDVTQITEDNTLTVIGNAGDTVKAIGFSPVGSENGLNKFASGDIFLFVDPEVTVG